MSPSALRRNSTERAGAQAARRRALSALLAAAIAALAGCATPRPPAPLFVESPAGWHPPPRDKAQIVFLAPGALPEAADANALFELAGGGRALLGALAAHGGTLQEVAPGHHVFMACGRRAWLLEADVQAGARYYVLMRADGGALRPFPLRMTEDAAISNRSAESGQWLADTELVEMTPAARVWFGLRAADIAAAEASARAAWQRASPAERAAATLRPEDAVLR